MEATRNLGEHVAEVYADGGCIAANPSPYGGTWAYRWLDAQGQVIFQDSGLILPSLGYGSTISNNVAELVAVLNALTLLPDDWAGTVCTDSNVTLGRCAKNWALTGVPDDVKAWLFRTQSRPRWRDLRWVLIGGHPTLAEVSAAVDHRGLITSRHNVWCDSECKRLAKQFMRSRQAAEGSAILPAQRER